MTDYTYTFLSLDNNQVIEEIPMFGVFAQRILCSPGQFNGTYNLDQTGKQNADLVAATIPGRTWMVMEREGVPVWWGLVWSRNYQSQAKSMQIFCWGFEAYPTRQLILTDFVRTGANQLQTFIDLWNNMQSSKPGRNLNIIIPSSPIASVNKDVSILATDYKYYHDAMNSLANAADGFDWTIQVDKIGGGYQKKLILGYPVLGATNSPSTVTFEYPGNILNYYETESLANAGTHTFGFGAGEGKSQLVSVFGYEDMVNLEGWPRWDIEVSMKDITNQTVLDSLTKQEAIKRKPPYNVYTATMKGDLDPIFGSYALGDACRMSIKDPKHPITYQIDTRIVGFELTPQSASSTEEVKLILPGDDVNGKIPVAAQ